MYCAPKLHSPNSLIEPRNYLQLSGKRTLRCPIGIGIRLPPRRVSAIALQTNEDVAAEPSASAQYHFTSSVGSSTAPLRLSQWTLTQRHVTLLNVIACAAAISTTWFFCSAIPTLLAFKRAAESLEKLMDVTREELPDTMAAIRLSGMEISDLTMELSDLGQEITQGVRSSTRAVRMAEERLRRLTNATPAAVSLQEVATAQMKTKEPVMARTARGVKEGVVKGRAMVQMFFTVTRLSRLVFKYMAADSKQ